MEERDDGALELGAASGVDGRGAERLPDYILADVGRNEETDAAAQAVSLLQQLVEGENDESRAEELGNYEEGVAGPDGGEVAVHAAHHVGYRLSHGDQYAEKLLGPSEKSAVLLDVVIHLDDATTGEKLHN